MRGAIGFLLFGAVGCATGSSGDSTLTDASHPDATSTSDAGRDVGCPTGHTGPGCQECAGGFHMCGSSCEQDHPNVPDAGCTNACNGATCPSPDNGAATCTTDGTCSFACNNTFEMTDAGTCDCPDGLLACFGLCQQCCSDGDCPNHLSCAVGGICTGCQANWGDCNNNASDGCETELNSDSNCGSCGNGCCSAVCGCGFLGLGGKSCQANGASFSCQC